MTSLQGKRTVIAALVTACTVVVMAGVFMSYKLNKNPPFAIATQVTQEEPATTAGSSVPVLTTGCWDVAITNDTDVAATWIPACAGAPAVTLGEQPWPQGVVRLPAWSKGEPPMSWAQAHVEMSRELAQHGSGALLYLPVNSDGSGYFVAAWALEATVGDEDSDPAPAVKRGLSVGVYGAPPTSVVTPAGRVYFNTDLSPKVSPGSHHESTSADDEDDTDSDDDDGTDSATALGATGEN